MSASVRVACSCGEVYFLSQAARCYKCGRSIAVDVESLNRFEAQEKDRIENYNLFIRKLSALRIPGDRGAGDTAARLIDSVGGAWIKKGFELIGVSCGCESRQAWLNEHYPW